LAGAFSVEVFYPTSAVAGFAGGYHAVEVAASAVYFE
jgi:hypothetical protein